MDRHVRRLNLANGTRREYEFSDMLDNNIAKG